MTNSKRSKITKLLQAITAIAVCLPMASFATTKNGFPLDDALVPTKEILGGGPPRDGIPSLDNPKFVAADDAEPQIWPKVAAYVYPPMELKADLLQKCYKERTW